MGHDDRQSPALSSSPNVGPADQGALECGGDGAPLWQPSPAENMPLLDDATALDWTLVGDTSIAGEQNTREDEALTGSCAPLALALSPISCHAMQRDARKRALAASSSSRYRHRKKLETDALKEWVAHLSAHLMLLRGEQQQLQRSKAAAHYAEVATAERRRRQASERQNAALRDSLYAQRVFLLNLKSLLASSVTLGLSAELNLHELLHSYCRLGESERQRARAAEAVFSDAKLDLAVRVVLGETASMRGSVSGPMIISSCVTSSATMIGATQKSVFAFDAVDLPRATVFALEGAHKSGQEWPQHSLVSEEFVGNSPSHNLRFEASTVRFCSVNSGNAVLVESRSVSCVRATDEYCLLVTDCVDEDELYPMAAAPTCVKQDMVAVFLLRRETCDDGVERVVCRAACTKLHSSDATSVGPREDARQFAQHSEVGMQLCGAWMYQHMKRYMERSTAERVDVYV